jgi:hypothetical protein
MKIIAFLTISLLLANPAAIAGTVNGNGALALAALVIQLESHAGASEKKVLEKYLNGKNNAPYRSKKKITVKADAITCKASNVDITQHTCNLTFGAKKVKTTHGRKAHELYATLAEVGVPAEGAAGSIIAAISNLDCTVDPVEVKKKAGNGAQCKYDPAK